MAVPTFSEYTYKISYKATSSSAEVILSEELRIIEAKTNIIDDSGASVEAPNPNYDYFMTALVCKVTPQKNTTLIIKRNAVRDGESIIAEEQTVYSGNFDFLDYDRRMGILFQDTEVGQSTQYKILAQVLNVNDMERIPCKYVFTGVEFTNNPNIAQHIDIAYRAADANDFIPLGTDITVPSNGVLDGIELGELPDDKDYVIKIYHRETETEKLFQFRTNIVPTIGSNPIIGKIEWNGRIMLLDAPNVKSRMYPSADAVDWMFPMDYSTKSFANILSSLLTSDPKEDYHFTIATDAYNQDVTYVGCEISNDNQITLPWNYTNDKLEDNGESHNIRYKDLFGDTADPKVRRAIFFRFMIKETKVNTTIEPYMVNLLGFTQLDANRFIGIKYDTAGPKFHVFGTDYDFPDGTQLFSNHWYGMVMVCKSDTILYANIFDKDNYKTIDIVPGHGVKVGDINSMDLINPAYKQDVQVELTYSTENVADETNMGLYIEWAIYKWDSASEDNSIIRTGKSSYRTIKNNVTNGKFTVTVPNTDGYGIKLSYGVAFVNGVSTGSGTVTINNFVCGTVSIMQDYLSEPPIIDTDCYRWIQAQNPSFAWAKTSSVVPDSPMGGILVQNMLLPDNVADSAPMSFGAFDWNNTFIINDFGLSTRTIEGNDSWKDPYQYIDYDVVEMLATGYKKMPVLKVNDEITIPTTNMTEMKDNNVRFLLSGLPVGEVDIDVVSNTDVLSTTHRTIKSIKLTKAEADYDIDFENDFDNAIVEFKKRYYAKQKRWGGNMGGGTHGSLIYFNSKEKCLILEQHGDKYNYRVPAVAPAGSEGYGLPVDIIECPSSFEYPLQQRCTRVGGLVQSVDYHPYGMFDCWFQVPKGMTGLAICLWYFHYQEIYDYDATFKFWTETGVNGYNYKDCVKTGYGATWVVINNEIDMELGSENTPYRTSVNPNNDQSIYWFVPGLSMRQAIGCTQTGENYGTWIIDWEASKATIEAVTSTDPKQPESYVRSDNLVWVKISDTIDEVNYGANTRSCRFNNWMAEQWNDGCGIYGDPSGSQLGKSELTVNNRTPLGELVYGGLDETLKYVEHYYDDGEYHKWSIDWTKDYTRLLIDDDVVAICKAFVPFNPMTMLIGCWFPSANVYDKAAILGEWGTWSGVHANWEVGLMKVKHIKFSAYTEEEVPTINMRYDCETYAEDGLKEIL